MTDNILASVVRYTLHYTSIHPTLHVQPLIMVNRFLINLRSLSNIANSLPNSDNQDSPRFSLPDFRVSETLLGNIGEPLEHGTGIEAEQDILDSALANSEHDMSSTH